MQQPSERPVGLTGRYRRLVNEFQRDFPLTPRPFRDIGERLDWSEAQVLDALYGLTATGVVSRVGPVIRPNTIGVSALAAMAVPARRLQAVADMVSCRPEVNHNYEREHRFNLWFVVTASDGRAFDEAIRRIEADSGLPVMVLPMLDDYYIDLGFDLDGGDKPRAPAVDGGFTVDAKAQRLLHVVQDGLALVARPYAAAASAAAMTEDQARSRLAALVNAGVIKRLGVIVRHHECGFRHNAMVVWDVPDDSVHAAGRALAGMHCVRLCYRRPRRPPDWPYNLFCMIHGRDRSTVLGEVERVAVDTGLSHLDCDVLFSARRFKQRGARYAAAPDVHRGQGISA